MRKCFFLLFALGLAYGCGNNPDQRNKVSDSIVRHKPDTAMIEKHRLSQQDSVLATGRAVLQLLKAKNYTGLGSYFSPQGVLFSPYGHIDTAKSKKLGASDFLESIDKNWILTWGYADGTGEPIKLTVAAYLKRYVYDADYLHAEAVGFDEVLKSGNSAVNIDEIYPKHHFIDYHFSGFDQGLKGMDWSSLRLVFEKRDGQYFLVAIVHDQWTI